MDNSYALLYEAHMFELHMLESYTMENINESIGEVISSIIKKIFGTLVKIIKGFFEFLGNILGLGSSSGGSVSEVANASSKLNNSKTKNKFKNKQNKVDIEDIANRIVLDNLIESDQEEGLKLLLNLLTHPAPNYSKFDNILEQFHDSSMYDIQNEKFSENIVTKLFPNSDIKLDGDNKLSDEKIVNYLFEERKDILSKNEINSFMKLDKKIKSAFNKVSANIHKNYKEVMGELSETPDGEENTVKFNNIKAILNKNLNFITYLITTLKPILADGLNYINISNSLYKIFDKNKTKLK